MSRPVFSPTDDQRQRVATAAGAGWTRRELAEALGVSIPTLRRAFARELEQGRAQRRIDAAVILFERAMAGNVAAMRHYLRGLRR